MNTCLRISILTIALTLFHTGHCYELKSDTITIVKGDNLWSIALEKYNDGLIAYDLWGHRIDKRPGNPNSIKPGMQFLLVSKEDLFKRSANPDSLNIQIEQYISQLNRLIIEADSVVKLMSLSESDTNQILKIERYRLPNELITICVAFIVAILSIALPMLIQSISRFQKDYNSYNITALIQDFNIYLLFQYLMIASVSWLGLMVFSFNFFDTPEVLIIPSEYILFLLTSALVTFLFLIVFRIIRVDSPDKLLEFLIKKHDRGKNKEFYFKAIADLLTTSIKRNDSIIAQKISDFIGECFKNQREKSNIIDYPKHYYLAVHYWIFELLESPTRRMVFLEYRVGGSLWILGSIGKKMSLSDRAYAWLWENLKVIVERGDHKMIMYHWRTAFEFYRYNMGGINYDEDDSEKIKTKKLEFLEFHYALGGLLFYSDNLDIIRRTFSYTMSIPADYELFPKTLNQILESYFKFNDPFNPWLLQKFKFPNTDDSITSENTTQTEIINYLALLFIRQTGQPQQYYGIDPSNIVLPTTQEDRKAWKEELPFFMRRVERIFKDKNVLKQTDLDYLDKEWFEKNKRPDPISILENCLQDVSDQYNSAQVTQGIAEQKIEEFFQESNRLLSDVFDTLSKGTTSNLIENDKRNWSVIGVRTLLPKAAFALHQGVDYIEYAKISAQYLTTKLYEGFSQTYFLSKSKYYSINLKDLNTAFEKLELNPRDHIIIGFGLNIEYLTNYVTGLNEVSLNGISLVNYDRFNGALMDQAFFILNKSDVPYMWHKEVTKDVTKYNLKAIIPEKNIFGNIIDLNSNEDLLEELKIENPDKEDLNKDVLSIIAMNTVISWKSKTKLIMIEINYGFKDKSATDVNTIVPFDKH